MKNYKFKFWHYGLIVTLLGAALITYNLQASDKSYFLSGDATHGHHQIEMSCSTCHGDGFAGQTFIQGACVHCHSDELEMANDSHPRSKFLDPRNAGLLAHLDARQCISCHTEHKPEITHEMGVTLAGDFCFHCHSDIAENRPNHEDFGFETCASAGCHNYHDNRYLYEEFLAERIDHPALVAEAQLPMRSLLAKWQQENPETKALELADADFSKANIHDNSPMQSAAEAWAHSTHAATGTNCNACHINGEEELTSTEVVSVCGDCHSRQLEQFSQGKHGMRLSVSLPVQQPMSPGDAQIPMKARVIEMAKELNCVSCHNPHDLDTRVAEVKACLSCHNDKHSLAYQNTEHFRLWDQQQPNGVSCANCHLPREEHKGQILVNHNQNHNLRPNEKMLPVCLNCHGVEFAVAALADERLIESNFNNEPDSEHKTFELIRERIARIKMTR
ncbi:cytochrome c3 family protein [Microbulbifer agarilyticus]|uniref:cytochrome c3 family protein n=1 Tax=Microbulbifer agarilyticus TaxID=260552 RepID=UPI001CD4AB05|nr:cytochrome c3 family protein [Microbulbifer agarilyticus]MCA0892465.1 cytochrome c3 family protein [Microbulbifer agarilyticus]